MKAYILYFISPTNASEFIGDPVQTDIRPQKGDRHTINGKVYEVTDTADDPTQHRDGPPWQKHVRVAEVVKPSAPATYVPSAPSVRRH